VSGAGAHDQTGAHDETGKADDPGGSKPTEPVADDEEDEEEVESFPASDPHSDWAGPPA
jgi:hypothetical protein